MIFDIKKLLWKSKFGTFNLVISIWIQLTVTSWFLTKNLSNFISLPWILHNWYYHSIDCAHFQILPIRSDNPGKEPKSNQETSEMHASIPPIVRNGNQFEYHNSWYIQSLNTTKVSEGLPFRKIKVINLLAWLNN